MLPREGREPRKARETTAKLLEQCRITLIQQQQRHSNALYTPMHETVGNTFPFQIVRSTRIVIKLTQCDIATPLVTQETVSRYDLPRY